MKSGNQKTTAKRRELLIDSLEQRRLFSAAGIGMVAPEVAAQLGHADVALEPEQAADAEPTFASEATHSFSSANDARNAALGPVSYNELYPTYALGDVNRDNAIDAADIDLLGQRIQQNTPLADADAHYDLNRDGNVDQADMDMMIHDVLNTEYGDANLDGVVNTRDGEIVVANMFMVGAGWDQGDFNSDGVVDGSDMITWHANKVLLNSSGTVSDIASQTEADADEEAGGGALFGDVNLDGEINVDDIDALCQAMASNQDDVAPELDLNNDGVLNQDDMDMMIHGVFDTNYGDANLDGQVNQLDAQILFGNMFTIGHGWGAGDFTCDGVVDGQDMMLWNDNKVIVPLAPEADADEVEVFVSEEVVPVTPAVRRELQRNEDAYEKFKHRADRVHHFDASAKAGVFASRLRTQRND